MRQEKMVTDFREREKVKYSFTAVQQAAPQKLMDQGIVQVS